MTIERNPKSAATNRSRQQQHFTGDAERSKSAHVATSIARNQRTVHHINNMSSVLPPLNPKVDAILVLDGDGNRLAGKYYGDFMKVTESGDDARVTFERQLHAKIHGMVARPDAAEVMSVMGKTAVFCGGAVGGRGSDVRVVHIGPSNESELVLAHLAEGMYEALNHLMGGTTDRTVVLDNLELVFLLIDEHCDGGIILETDGNKLASSVLLRDDDGAAEPIQAGTQGLPPGVAPGDMTIGQALMHARQQLINNLGQRDGM